MNTLINADEYALKESWTMITKNFLKRSLKRICTLSLRPFFKNGIDINIENTGSFRFDTIFAFSNFGSFGKRHNSGFKRWLDACRKKRSIFDIGAYIGLYSIPVSSAIDEEGAIYAFEPSSPNRFYLERHIRLNNAKNIKVFPCLMGEETKDKALFYENRDVDGMDSIAIWKNPDFYNKVFKKQISLDNFCRDKKTVPEIIKIDVEGAELNVLKGGADTIRECAPLIFLSVHPKRLRLLKQSVGDLKAFIDSLDYAIYDTDGKIRGNLEFGEYILIPAGRRFDEIF